MEGPCPATEHWPGSGLQRLGKAAALESYLDGIKIRLWPRKKSEAFGRRRQCHQRVRRRLLGSSWSRRRAGPEDWVGSDRETQNQRKSWTRGKEWLCSVYSVKEGVTGSRPGPGGGCLGASSKAGRGGGVTQDVGGGSLRAQSPTAREKKLEKVVWSQRRKHSEIAHYSWWEYYSDSAAWIYLVNFKRKLCNISFKLDLVFRVIVGSS